MDFEITEEQKMIAETARRVGEQFGLDYWRGDHIHLEMTTAADQAVLANTGATRSWFASA